MWLQTHKLEVIQEDFWKKSMEESYVCECFKTISTGRHCKTHTPLIKETDGLLARTTTFIENIDGGLTNHVTIVELQCCTCG